MPHYAPYNRGYGSFDIAAVMGEEEKPMAVVGASAVLVAEINAGVEIFKLLEPEVQKGFIALFHVFHRKQQQISAAQFLAEAATELQQAKAVQPAVPFVSGSAGEDLSSTSLDPDVLSTS
jgi:hypothetical protein